MFNDSFLIRLKILSVQVIIGNSVAVARSFDNKADKEKQLLKYQQLNISNDIFFLFRLCANVLIQCNLDTNFHDTAVKHKHK